MAESLEATIRVQFDRAEAAEATLDEIRRVIATFFTVHGNNTAASLTAARDLAEGLRQVLDRVPLEGQPTPAAKLVRDKIPDLIRSQGLEPVTRIAGDAEYPALLRDKLREEAGEFLSSGDPEELADVLEVVRSLAALAGVSPEGLEGMRAVKAVERGGFAGRVVWAGNRETQERSDEKGPQS